MKLLIASEGRTLEHRVARKFAHARFFLEVDCEQLSLSAVHNVYRKDRAAILQKAVLSGIEILITGNIGPHGFALLGAQRMKAAFSPGTTGNEALARYSRNELKVLDAPTMAQSLEEHELHERQKRLEHTKGRSGKMPGRSGGPTPRGRHHIQQFGGRGH
jgi:predicted Fe-Mo cluster-binding NifX family protein